MNKKTKFIWFVFAACVAVIAWFIARHLFRVAIGNENVVVGLVANISALITTVAIIAAISFLIYMGVSENTESKPKVYGGAIFALVLSSLCFFIPIIGQIVSFYVCGRVLFDIKKSDGLLRGKFLAIAGIGVSIVSLIIYAAFFIRQKYFE